MAKQSPMTRRLARQTETDLKKLAVDVEKRALAIGGRFGDIDQAMVNQADDLIRLVDGWSREVREHMAQQVEEDAWNL